MIFSLNLNNEYKTIHHLVNGDLLITSYWDMDPVNPQNITAYFVENSKDLHSSHISKMAQKKKTH